MTISNRGELCNGRRPASGWAQFGAFYNPDGFRGVEKIFLFFPA
jgi:hypothetical protein